MDLCFDTFFAFSAPNDELYPEIFCLLSKDEKQILKFNIVGSSIFKLKKIYFVQLNDFISEKVIIYKQSLDKRLA